MPIESVNYQCPACGGPLRYDGAEAKLVCDYCDSRFEVTEVEALYAEQQRAAEAEAAQAQAEAAQAAREATEAEAAASADDAPVNAVADAAAAGSDDASASDAFAQAETYICSSCGAELISDGTVAVSTCPYCGNPAVAPGRLSGQFSPDVVIPFKLARADAVSALDGHYKGKVLLPKRFKSENHIEEVQGVYVPFWLYDADASGSAVFEATRERRHFRGDDEIIETDHFTCNRAGSMEFERIPVDGSSRMPDGHMDAIEPFDYADLKQFSVAYLPGFLTNRWDEDAKTCRPRAELRVTNSMESALRSTVHGYDTVTCMSSDVDCGLQEAQCALFPVWMLSTIWEGKNYLFAMNGQTGRMVGDLPVSKPKLAGICAVTFGVLLAAAWYFMDGSSMLESGETFWSLLLLFAVPLLVTVIVGVVLVGQMHTAVCASQADAYVEAGSFDLTTQGDHYTHTTRRVIHHEKKKD